MRKLVITLAISTCTLAASTLWLAREAARERAGNPAAPATDIVAVAVPAQQGGPTPRAPVEITPAPPSAPATAPAAYPPGVKSPREYAREYLESISTPEGRARLLAESRQMLATTYPPPIVERLGLTRADLDRFLDVKSEAMFAFGETMARCQLSPGCDVPSTGSAASAEAGQRVLDVMGAEKVRALESYEDSVTERRVVARLRGQLPDSAYLSDESSERLVAALAGERRRYQSQNSSPESGPSSIGTLDGQLYYMPLTTSDDMLASAEEYAQRLHRQAAAILDARQLSEFDEMQRRVLLRLREQLAENEAQRTSGP
jgi:hypothetical protein